MTITQARAQNLARGAWTAARKVIHVRGAIIIIHVSCFCTGIFVLCSPSKTRSGAGNPKVRDATPRPRRGGPSCLGQTAPVPSPLVPYNTVVEDWDEVLKVTLPKPHPSGFGA